MERFKGEGCGRHVLDAFCEAREHMGQVKGPNSGRPCGPILPFSIRFAVGMAFSALYTLFPSLNFCLFFWFFFSFIFCLLAFHFVSH